MTAYWIYNSFLTLALIVILPALPLFFLLRLRLVSGFADRVTWYSGEIRQTLRATRPVWIHAVSAGEVLSMDRLVMELKSRFPHRKILVSSSTSTGVEIARKIRAGNAVIYFPWDHPLFVRRALNIFDPSLVIVLETEIWPNFLWSAYRRGVPVLLLSGRISPRSLRRYRCFRWLFGSAIRKLTALGMQTESDAERMLRFGVDPGKVCITGNLKHAAPSESFPHDVKGIPSPEWWPDRSSVQKVWVAGSTHRGEESVILDVFEALRPLFPGLFMVLAPRHPHRFAEVEKLLQKKNIMYVKRSQTNGTKSIRADVMLLDTIGELPAFYASADVTFVGGSLIDAGGHNILEPARLRKPVFFGPYMGNFAETAAEMKKKGGGALVRGKDEFVRELSRVLADPGAAKKMGEKAYAVVAEDKAVLGRSLELVARYLV